LSASTATFSEPWAVSMITWMSGSATRARRCTSAPLISGIRRSVMSTRQPFSARKASPSFGSVNVAMLV